MFGVPGFVLAEAYDLLPSSPAPEAQSIRAGPAASGAVATGRPGGVSPQGSRRRRRGLNR
jgi:hypothetical protein